MCARARARARACACSRACGCRCVYLRVRVPARACFSACAYATPHPDTPKQDGGPRKNSANGSNASCIPARRWGYPTTPVGVPGGTPTTPVGVPPPRRWGRSRGRRTCRVAARVGDSLGGAERPAVPVGPPRPSAQAGARCMLRKFQHSPLECVSRLFCGCTSPPTDLLPNAAAGMRVQPRATRSQRGRAHGGLYGWLRGKGGL